jgi:hypothetical protein
VTDRIQLRRALTISVKLTLTRAERHDLAEYLTGHEGSWTTISEDDAKRVADALFAWWAVQWLIQDRTPERPPIPAPAGLRRSA